MIAIRSLRRSHKLNQGIQSCDGWTPLESEQNNSTKPKKRCMKSKSGHSLMKAVHSLTGWTLVEVMVATVILAILAISAFTVFKVGVDTWHRRGVYSTLQADVRRAMERMSREVHQSSFNSPYGINASGSTLVFEILEPDDSWSRIQYSLGGSDGTVLLRHGWDGGNEEWIGGEVVANNVLQLTFTYDSVAAPRVIGIDMRVSKSDMLGRAAEVRTNSQVTMRN